MGFSMSMIVPTKETFLSTLKEIGPKALLYTALSAPLILIRDITNAQTLDSAKVKSAAHDAGNSAARFVTAAGWLDFALTVLDVHRAIDEKELKEGQKYPLTKSAKFSAFLAACASGAGAYALAESGKEGREVHVMIGGATSGLLAAGASVFAQKYKADVINNKVPPRAKPDALLPVQADSSSVNGSGQQGSAPPVYGTLPEQESHQVKIFGYGSSS